MCIPYTLNFCWDLSRIKDSFTWRTKYLFARILAPITELSQSVSETLHTFCTHNSKFQFNWSRIKGALHSSVPWILQGDSFGTRPKKMWISQRLFIRFWTCIYDYIPCFMKSMLILVEMLEMFATTVQVELNATIHVCKSGLQDILTNRSNFTSNVVFQFLYGVWLVGISFSF